VPVPCTFRTNNVDELKSVDSGSWFHKLIYALYFARSTGAVLDRIVINY